MRSLAPLLGLVGFGALGTVFWVASPEAALVVGVSNQHVPPVLAALLVAAGQGIAIAALLLFGEALRARWPWLDRRCARLHERHGARLARGRLPVAVTSGLAGVPPASVVALLAGSLGLRGPLLYALLMAARIARFTVIALAAASAVHLPLGRLTSAFSAGPGCRPPPSSISAAFRRDPAPTSAYSTRR